MSTQQPFFFKLPLSQFDTNLLPADAREIGSEAFKDAVIEHFAMQYATKGETALVGIYDDEISVVTLPKGTDPLEFVMSMLQNGRIKEAVPYLKSMDKTNPDNAQILYNLGIAYSELGQFNEAIIRLKKAVKLEPGHAHAWTGIGIAYQRSNKPEQALEAMQKAVEADPSDGHALRNLGGMLAALKRYPEAFDYLYKAQQALPDDPHTLYGLAMVTEKIAGENNLREADKLYKTIVQRWPASHFAEMAKEALTRIGNQSIRDKAIGNLRPDVVMYIAGALETFEKLGSAKRQQITFEVAMKGQDGLDIHNPTKTYTLESLPGKFTGIHLLSIMYAGFKQIDPTVNVGVDFQAEYDAAMAMHKK